MNYQLICGDAVEVLGRMANESVDCIVTSPPYYGLRDYGIEGQIGLEESPDAYVDSLIEVFREVRRVLAPTGTLWLNLGDSYANDGKWGGHTGGKHAKALHCSPIGRNKRYTGLKPKDLIGIPWMVAFALRSDGWWLRQDIIWSKPNPMPESVTDRCTKAHEYLFLLSKSERYFYDRDAIAEPAITGPQSEAGAMVASGKRRSIPLLTHRGKGGKTAFRGQRHFRETESGPANRDRREMRDVGAGMTRNRRSVWEVATKPFPGSHFAVMPEKLVEPCVVAGCPEGGTCLDPFAGSGTVGVVALRHGRSFIGIDLNPEYVEMARRRIYEAAPLLNIEESPAINSPTEGAAA